MCRFNLNLLECKLIICLWRVIFSVCFNLNLLECKFLGSLVSFSSNSVLISTYWNVNEFQQVYAYTQLYVLISTYWNVNLQLFNLFIASDSSFNLNLLECKSSPALCQAVSHLRFNLNLLECKFSWTPIAEFCITVLISTYWNVNLRSAPLKFAHSPVLISTYWNVNESLQRLERLERLF